MKNMIWLGLCVLFAVSCANAEVIKTYGETATEIVVVKQHPSFMIKLKSNPTTGYSWSLKDYDKSSIINTAHRFLPAQTNLMGAPGFEEWTFQVQPQAFVENKTLKLVFVYARPWEKTEKGEEVVFNVSVKKS